MDVEESSEDSDSESDEKGMKDGVWSDSPQGGAVDHLYTTYSCVLGTFSPSFRAENV